MIEAERLYKLNKKLYDQKAIGLQEYKQSENNFNYLKEKKNQADVVLREDSMSVKQEVNQARQSYQRTQNALDVMRKKVGDLIVRAPVDGQLTSLDAEIGQSKNKGERLGQIDVLSGFKVRVDIDEHYISRIYTDLLGSFTLAGKDYVCLEPWTAPGNALNTGEDLIVLAPKKSTSLWVEMSLRS